MQTTKYLLQIDTNLYGYDNLDVLRIHLAENGVKLSQTKLYRNNTGLIVSYTLLSQNEAQLEVYGEVQNEKNG